MFLHGMKFDFIEINQYLFSKEYMAGISQMLKTHPIALVNLLEYRNE